MVCQEKPSRQTNPLLHPPTFFTSPGIFFFSSLKYIFSLFCGSSLPFWESLFFFSSFYHFFFCLCLSFILQHSHEITQVHYTLYIFMLFCKFFISFFFSVFHVIFFYYSCPSILWGDIYLIFKWRHFLFK